jgi:hypothetical protein
MKPQLQHSMSTKNFYEIQYIPVPKNIENRTSGFVFAFIAALLFYSNNLHSQQPVLPPTNLGLSNIFDGFAGKPGFVYQGYVQAYDAKHYSDGAGNQSAGGLKVNSVVSLNQLIYLTPVRLLGGYLGFTTLIPIVQINASNLEGPSPSVNPGALGDIVVGTAVQWSDKKLFGKPFSHRAEFDVMFPSGAYDSKYAINASAHHYTFGIYHAFTFFMGKKVSLSARNQFNYNTHIIGTKEKPGAFYNGNYSVDYAVLDNLRIEAAMYYLIQLNQDSNNGNPHFYEDEFGISNTKERVLGFGPGLAYFAPNGILMEAKMFFEAAAQNRFEGNRFTLRIAIPLSK